MNAPASPPELLQALLAPVQPHLVEVEAILRREMRSRYSGVDELVRYGVMLGGKRLRPALLLLAAQACGRVTDEHLTLAAVVEMIHTATLVHDDVLDEADQRRHLATVNARWGTEASVLLGDFLFTHAFYLASTLDTTRGCRIIGRATNIVCEGELRQVSTRGNHELSESDYLEIIEAKTAELCACSCRLGAEFAGVNTDWADRLDRYGRLLGVAFQIADDLLDLVGEETATGKSLGTDLDKQKPTLPFIRARQVADPADRQRLIDCWQDDSPHRRETLLALLERCDALDYARDVAERLTREAAEQLSVLPRSDARDALIAITHFVVHRSH